MRHGTVLGLTFLLWLGCQARLFHITIDEAASSTVSQGTILEDLVGDLGFSDFLDMNIIEAEELANQGVEPGDVQEVHFTSFELEALGPAGADLSFLESVDLYVEAEGLDDVLFASAASFPEGQPLVAFDLEDVDLTDYVISESMTITTDVVGHRPDVDTDVEARFSIRVGVTGQGACNQIKGDEGE